MPTSFLSSPLVIVCLVPCLAHVFRLSYFDVEPATGLIYVKNQSLLDREGRSLYTATLQATDTDGKAGTTLLEITLTDVNDNHPVINRETYFEFVLEGQPFELTIQVNSQTTYLSLIESLELKRIYTEKDKMSKLLRNY